MLAAVLTVSPAAVGAQYGLSPEMTGAMHASAIHCGDYTAKQLAELKIKDRTQGLGRHMSAAAYEAAFQRGYKSADARISSGTPAAKAEHCRRARMLLNAGR